MAGAPVVVVRPRSKARVTGALLVVGRPWGGALLARSLVVVGRPWGDAQVAAALVAGALVDMGLVVGRLLPAQVAGARMGPPRRRVERRPAGGPCPGFGPGGAGPCRPHCTGDGGCCWR